MDIIDLMEYLNPKFIILIPVLYNLSFSFEKAGISEKYTPLVVNVLGMILCFLWIISDYNIQFSNEFFKAIFTATVQGVLVSTLSRYFHDKSKK